MECRMNPIISELHNHLFEDPKSIYGVHNSIYEIHNSGQAAP